jgi:hypothetical protein
MEPATESKKWKQMNGVEKLVFLGKLAIFVLTFGFAFPLLLAD